MIVLYIELNSQCMRRMSLKCTYSLVLCVCVCLLLCV